MLSSMLLFSLSIQPFPFYPSIHLHILIYLSLYIHVYHLCIFLSTSLSIHPSMYAFSFFHCNHTFTCLLFQPFPIHSLIINYPHLSIILSNLEPYSMITLSVNKYRWINKFLGLRKCTKHTLLFVVMDKQWTNKLMDE